MKFNLKTAAIIVGVVLVYLLVMSKGAKASQQTYQSEALKQATAKTDAIAAIASASAQAFRESTKEAAAEVANSNIWASAGGSW